MEFTNIYGWGGTLVGMHPRSCGAWVVWTRVAYFYGLFGPKNGLRIHNRANTMTKAIQKKIHLRKRHNIQYNVFTE